MWGRKSIYGKHVHKENKPAKSFVETEKKKEKKEQVKKTNSITPKKKNIGSDFEAEYLKFIEELKKQNTEKQLDEIEV